MTSTSGLAPTPDSSEILDMLLEAQNPMFENVKPSRIPDSTKMSPSVDPVDVPFTGDVHQKSPRMVNSDQYNTTAMLMQAHQGTADVITTPQTLRVSNQITQFPSNMAAYHGAEVQTSIREDTYEPISASYTLKYPSDTTEYATSSAEVDERLANRSTLKKGHTQSREPLTKYKNLTNTQKSNQEPYIQGQALDKQSLNNKHSGEDREQQIKKIVGTPKNTRNGNQEKNQLYKKGILSNQYLCTHSMHCDADRMAHESASNISSCSHHKSDIHKSQLSKKNDSQIMKNGAHRGYHQLDSVKFSHSKPKANEMTSMRAQQEEYFRSASVHEVPNQR